MSWWQRFSFRRKTPSILPASPDVVRGIAMTIPGWHEDAPSNRMRTWHHPRGGVLSAATISRAAIPPLTRLDLLRSSFRKLAEAKGAGLVEADVVQSAYGPSARLIYKRRQDSGFGFLFTGMLLLPVSNEWLVCTVVDAERGTTGIREAVVTDQLLAAGTLTVESYEESWARDPYDASYDGVDRSTLRFLSDDECYDVQFPEHPLSNVRATLEALLENVFVESEGPG